MAELEPERLRLGAFLSGVAARPFAWGGADCMTTAADWVLCRRGVDPAAEWRGSYASERGAARILARAGGLEALVMRTAFACGLEQTDAPRPGDVGVVDCGGRLVASIKTGIGWAVKTPAGLWVARMPFRQAWRV